MIDFDDLAVIGFADELCEDAALLAAWGATFDGEDPITLVIHPGRLGASEVAARIGGVAQAAGIGDGDGSAKLIALTGTLAADSEARLAARCAAVFSRRAAPETFAGLVRVDELSVAGLRALLGSARRAQSTSVALPSSTVGSAPVSFTMGRHSYYGTPAPQVFAYGEGRRVEVGNFCSISGDVRFYLDGGHRLDLITTSPLHSLGLPGPPGHNASKGPIVVGHDVWIGHSAVILSGVTIGTGAVVGTCAVVAADVRPYAVVVGNPAREIRRRFDDEECKLLLASRWWEWGDQDIRAALADLWSSDVRSFVARWASA